MPDEKRLWLDKADRQTVYALFYNQRFYAQQYVGADDEVRQFMELVELYHAWAQESYTRLRQGLEALEFPEVLRVAVRVNNAKEAPRGKTKAHTDASEG